MSRSWELEGLDADDLDARIESQALSAFLYDYCLEPQPSLHCHGYLHNLEALLKVADPASDLARATRAVALASLGSKLQRSDAIHSARVAYSELLESLQLKIRNGLVTVDAEAVLTIILLGLYEVRQLHHEFKILIVWTSNAILDDYCNGGSSV